MGDMKVKVKYAKTKPKKAYFKVTKKRVPKKLIVPISRKRRKKYAKRKPSR